jgi:hypothetical protein
MKRKIRLYFVIAVVICGAVGLAGWALTTYPVVESDELAQRGKELRAALERKYQQISAGEVRVDPFHGADVTDAVLPYIPVGSSFSDAETILRHAGFFVGGHPDVNTQFGPNHGKDWYAVLASISPFARWQMFFRTSLYVVLLPRSPGDYSVVSKIRATFFVMGP